MWGEGAIQSYYCNYSRHKKTLSTYKAPSLQFFCVCTIRSQQYQHSREPYMRTCTRLKITWAQVHARVRVRTCAHDWLHCIYTAAEIMYALDLAVGILSWVQLVRSEEWNPEWELVDPGMELSPTLQMYDIVNTYFLSCEDVSYSLAIWLWARLVVLHRATHNHSTLSWAGLWLKLITALKF